MSFLSDNFIVYIRWTFIKINFWNTWINYEEKNLKGQNKIYINYVTDFINSATFIFLMISDNYKLLTRADQHIVKNVLKAYFGVNWKWAKKQLSTYSNTLDD